MSTFTLTSADRTPLFVYRWLPADRPRAVVQIVHGMAEHAGRYDGLARALNTAGYGVYAHDQRGHGRTASTAADLGYFSDNKGWRACLDDIVELRRHIGSDHPDTPVILLGHSMGSFLAQQAAGENGDAFAGLALSGSYRQPRGLASAGALLARIEARRIGAHGRSGLLHALTLGAYNRRFAPARTPFDWLTRDADAVDRYAVDPLCGFRPTVQLWIGLLGALGAGLPLPPRHLPVYIMSGARDPVAAADPGARRLAAAFREAGLASVTHRVYPEARHELFHETNREEVMGDFVVWLDRVVPRI